MTSIKRPLYWLVRGCSEMRFGSNLESEKLRMRLAAVVKWYEMGILSQSKAAEVAGLSRSEFLGALARFGVSPFQYSAEKIVAEVRSQG